MAARDLRHRGHPQLPRDEVAPSPSASSSPLDLDESDDEDVSRGRPHFDAAPGDEEDTDSALEEIEEADEANDEAPSAAATPKRSPKRSFLRCLDGLPPRWKNWFIRAFSGLLLIVGFTFLVSLGASGLLFLTYLVLTSCYSEVTRLAFKVTGAPRSVYRRFVWTLYCLAQYSLAAPAALRHLSSSPGLSGLSPAVAAAVSLLERHHQAICFAAYVACLMWYVMLLDANYIRSYSLLAWCHMFFLFACVPGQMMNASTFNGLIWYVLPMSLITLNDIAAFYVGFFFGRTPLIKLSPKKTLEGFLGGGLLTVLLGMALCHVLCTCPSLLCPVVARDPVDFLRGRTSLLEVDLEECRLDPLFNQRQFVLLGGLLSLRTCPFVFTHGVVISLVCSLVGPFGGFLASGFKRGCRRKNFGSFIPGHGGVTDRCDCMFLCAAIIHVYYNTFIAQSH